MKRILVCLALALGALHLPAGAAGFSALPCSPVDLAAPVTLERAAEAALCSHPQALAAAARLVQAEAQVDQADAEFRPRLDLTVGLEDSNRSHGVRTNVGFSWVLFDFGARDARRSASVLTRHAVALEGDDAVQSVLMGTAERYFDLARAQAELDASRQAVEAAETSLDATRARYEAGVVPRVDVLQAQSRLSQVSLAHTRADAAVAVARARLAQFIGLSAQAPVQIIETDMPEQAAPAALDALVAQLASHPLMQAARQRESAAESQWQAARLRNKPTISLGASAIHATGGNNPQLVAGLTLVVPLTDAGLSQAQVRQAEGALGEARAAAESTRQQVELGIVAAHAELEAARQAARASRDWLVAAEATLEQAEGRYRAGAGLLTDWLDAQAQSQEARQAHASALYTWHQARLALARALGQMQLAGMHLGAQ